jgi:DNA-binding transcriptional regulator YhcF (GntR family)
MISTFRSFAQAKQDSKTPKYQQLVNTLLVDIEKGDLKTGERLPSINEASEECYLSRDTVERAYSELHRLGVITSIFRKGYFISGKSAKTKTKIFFLVGKITENNKAIFNAFVNYAGKEVAVDIFTYNYKSDNFRDIINNHLGNYHYYVIMPHLIEETDENIKCLKKISGERLIFLEQSMPSLLSANSSISCNSGEEIFNVLQQNAKYFKKYKTLNLVLTEEEYFDSALISGFRNFCETNHYDFQVLDGLEDEEVEQGHVYLTMDDADLVSAIKSVQNQGFELGKHVGIISLNDSCYKEILAGGISIISSKPKELGKLAADLIQSGKRQNINVSMEMILRKSL